MVINEKVMMNQGIAALISRLILVNSHSRVGGGVLKEKLHSQLVRQNLKGALLCGMYR